MSDAYRRPPTLQRKCVTGHEQNANSFNIIDAKSFRLLDFKIVFSCLIELDMEDDTLILSIQSDYASDFRQCSGDFPVFVLGSDWSTEVGNSSALYEDLQKPVVSRRFIWCVVATRLW